MLAEEADLEQLPVATEYKVLNRIGQGAFGEVGSDQVQNRPAELVHAVTSAACLRLYRS